MKYIEIGRAEMKPDMYSGKEFNEMKPQWEIYMDGDMESDICEVADFPSKYYHPGTIIKIIEPCCPKCGFGASICDCGFDWKEWTEEEYC